MNKTGKIQETDTSKQFRQFTVNSLGENDVGKYYMLSVFGEDSNIPKDTKVLTVGSANKDVKFIVGVSNKLKDDELNPGDKLIFSTNSDGSEIKSYIKLLNDGTIHFNGDADNIVGFADLKAGFDELKEDYNNHIHKIPAGEVIISVSGGSGAPAVGVSNPTPIDLSDTTETSSASIDTSKKDNLKIE